MTEIILNDLAYSNVKLRAKESLYDMIIGDTYEVVCPNSFESDNDGFLIKSLTNADYCQIVENLTDKRKKIMIEYEFPIIEWKDFFKYFDILKE